MNKLIKYVMGLSLVFLLFPVSVIAEDRTAILPDGTKVLLRDNGTWEEIKSSVMAIDCYWNNHFNIMMLDSYFAYVNSDYESKPDGEYVITIYSNYINGDFKINKIVSIPYIKTKSTFAPKYDSHWDTRMASESEKEILQNNGEGSSECTIKTIVYKG
jgi:hypothetical protein